MDRKPDRPARYRGCLLAAAAGDALGAAVEFARTPAELIALSGGPGGVRDYLPAYGRLGAVTDDTQMAMATALGLLDAVEMAGLPGPDAVLRAVYQAYLAWFESQADPVNRRAPGRTCLGALGSGRMGTPDQPINNSKGSGGVMRAAPVGLAYPGDPDTAFAVGLATAAITHGHPGAYLPAGYLAALVARLVVGDDLPAAIWEELVRPALTADGGEVRDLLTDAVGLAGSRLGPWESFDTLGAEGWTGDEGLAIALFSALRHSDSLEEAVATSVFHIGDSDTTGTITGAIMGTVLGVEAIPARWLEPLEARAGLEDLAGRLHSAYGRRV